MASRITLTGLLVACALLGPRPSWAEDSVADKANARTLATEGIDLYGEARFAEALDRLQRAQALFDAPIHLLYIARAQSQLGKLVEATETYRRLIRVELTADTPVAVREAVESADAELDGVVARIAAVRIDVVPQGEADLTLRIDGVAVSPAVIGVDRPMNPGRHRFEARAPDGRAASVELELGEAAREFVQLELGAGPTPSMPPRAPRQEPSLPPAAPALGVFAGAGIGLWLPFGELAAGVPANDSLKAGIGFELEGGLRFARFFGAKLFLHAASAAGVNPERDSADFAALASAVATSEGDKLELETSASALGAGLSLLVGSPPGKLGGYGELGLGWQRLSIVRDSEFSSVSCGGNAQQTLRLTGPALRAGGGVTIPVSRSFALSPFAHLTFARYAKAALDSDCEELALPGPTGLDGSLDASQRATHGQLLFGLGGQFIFGSQ